MVNFLGMKIYEKEVFQDTLHEVTILCNKTDGVMDCVEEFGR